MTPRPWAGSKKILGCRHPKPQLCKSSGCWFSCQEFYLPNIRIETKLRLHSRRRGVNRLIINGMDVANDILAFSADLVRIKSFSGQEEQIARFIASKWRNRYGGVGWVWLLPTAKAGALHRFLVTHPTPPILSSFQGPKMQHFQPITCMNIWLYCKKVSAPLSFR